MNADIRSRKAGRERNAPVVEPLHLDYSPQECLHAAQISGGEFREYFQVSPSPGEEGGEGFGGVGGELIAVGFRDILDEAVGSEQADQASDPLAFLALVQARLVGQQAFAQVAVAEPVQRELAAADRLQQAGIGLGQRVQREGGATVERGPLTDGLRRLTEGGGRLDGGQSLKVALVALLADLSETGRAAAVQIGHAFAEREPVRASGQSAAARFCPLSPAIGTAIGVDSTAGERGQKQRAADQAETRTSPQPNVVIACRSNRGYTAASSFAEVNITSVAHSVSSADQS